MDLTELEWVESDWRSISNWMEFVGEPRQLWLRDESLPARLHLTCAATAIANRREADSLAATTFGGNWWPLWRALRRAADQCEFPTAHAVLDRVACRLRRRLDKEKIPDARGPKVIRQGILKIDLRAE
ncbi:MAG: hypothetical protein AB7K24_33840 [Gemmataceae bacterium]